MISSPSPPQEAEHIRGKTLTPESPKPVHYPSPSNIPILEKQMDPMFHEGSLNIDTPASYNSYPQTHTPSAQSTTPYFTEQQNVAAQNPIGAAGSAEYNQAMASAYGGLGTQTQDTSIQNMQPQYQAANAQFREANSTPSQDLRSANHPSYDPNAYATQPGQAQPPQNSQYQLNPGGNVDVQALLDSLSPAAHSAASERYATPSQASQSQIQTPISSIPVAANLPPRPPAQEKPTTHPNYNAADDIRSYHPHSGKPPNNQYRGSAPLQELNTRGAQGYQAVQSATRSNQSPSTPGYGHRQSVDLQSESPGGDEDSRWPPEVNKLYEDFLEEERKFVTDGQWDQFPTGSRLFIGNLPTEKVTKRDIFHRFYKHGALAQISIKQAYGFVQFLDAASCYRALQAEQGKPVRGRKMHLEISKPQRNKKNDSQGGARRRSRSPDYSRGGTGAPPRNVDRYTGGQNMMSPRDRDNRRMRDDLRSVRSPSPRGSRGGRGRDRSRDRYDGWRRSRSRSPRRYGRSPSPRRRSMDDDLPLPHRPPHQVPDVQVLVINEGLPRDFIRWVEDTFKQQGLRIDVLILSPRLSEAAVIRRQIVEGVLAIVKLDTAALSKSKVNLQVFDRRGGANNVQFNEYADLEPNIAAALVVQTKQAQSQPAPPAPSHPYGQPYGAPQAPPAPSFPNPNPGYGYPPTPTNNNPNLSNMISSLDSSGLSQLLSTISGHSASAAQAPPGQTPPDLARLLSSMSNAAPAPSYPAAAPPNQYGQSTAAQNLSAFLGGQSQGAHQPGANPMQSQAQASTGQPDMNEIMAQLAKYQR